MTVLLSDVENALQKVIMPYIKDNLPKETILLDQLKRNVGTQFMNNYFYAPIRSSRHGGVTNLATDDSTLITGKASISQAAIPTKIVTGTFDISKLTIDASSSTKGAVESMLKFQAKSLASDVARSINRQYYGDGLGLVAQVSASANASAVVMMYPNSSVDGTVGGTPDYYGTINGDISPTKYLAPGMHIGVGADGTTVGTIASISGATAVMTGTLAHAANDSVYILDGDNSGAGSAEITGIRAALSASTGTSTYAGVARSTIGWTPQLGTTAEALTLSAIEDKYLSAIEYAQMGDRFAIFMNKSLYKKYGDLLTAYRRTVNSTELLGGWKGLEFAAGGSSVGVFLDFDVPDGEVIILNLDTWTICQVSDMDWLDDPSGSLIRRRDKITYQATMVWFTNLLCTCPAANGRLCQKTD